MVTLTFAWFFWTILCAVAAFWGISFVQHATAKKILYGVAILVLALWLMQSFGLIAPIINIRIK